MKLKLYAKQGHVIPWPNQNRSGQPRRYVGRGTELKPEGIMHPAQETPVEVDSDSPIGQRIARLFAIEEEGPMWPADKATADFLDEPFRAVKFNQALREFEVEESSEPQAEKKQKGSDK